MAQTREIKKRMVAVANIRRITKTMQMIATAKFTAAQIRAQSTKPYTEKIHQLVSQVAAAAGDVDHPLIKGPDQPVGRELLLVISSDRGLCGAFNANVLRKGYQYAGELEKAGKSLTLQISGKKAIGYFKFQGIEVDQGYLIGDKPRYEEVERIADQYIKAFSDGEFDAVRVAYMRFLSAGKQVPEVAQLLPLEPEVSEKASKESSDAGALYDFSPSSQALLSDLLPRAVKTMLFQAFNDAVVSEQIMRMIAMKAATENAGDLGKTLKRRFNRARQTQITTELMEIIAGAAALE